MKVKYRWDCNNMDIVRNTNISFLKFRRAQGVRSLAEGARSAGRAGKCLAPYLFKLLL